MDCEAARTSISKDGLNGNQTNAEADIKIVIDANKEGFVKLNITEFNL